MIIVKKSGNKPLKTFAAEKSLLVAAWAYGLKENDTIHRFVLFAFVQSHITNSPEENLQGFIEKNSLNWTKIGDGYYKLTSVAYQAIQKFGKPNIVLPKKLVYTFKRKIDRFDISVTIDDSIKRGYILKQNGLETKADIIIKNIIDITNDNIPTEGTSLPRKVFNWILSGPDYDWIIET